MNTKTCCVGNIQKMVNVFHHTFTKKNNLKCLSIKIKNTEYKYKNFKIRMEYGAKK